MLFVTLLFRTLVALPTTTTCPSDRSIASRQDIINLKDCSKAKCLEAAQVAECKSIAAQRYTEDGSDWCGDYSDCMTTIGPAIAQLSIYCYWNGYECASI